MNRQQAQGKWEQIRGTAKKVWGDLTDDDFTRAEGSLDKLCGVIHERFGDAKDSIKKKFESHTSKH